FGKVILRRAEMYEQAAFAAFQWDRCSARRRPGGKTDRCVYCANPRAPSAGCGFGIRIRPDSRSAEVLCQLSACRNGRSEAERMGRHSGKRRSGAFGLVESLQKAVIECQVQSAA